MIGSEDPVGSPSKNQILFEYRWVVTRELDRINRSTQGFTSLDARIHKLRSLAEPYLWAEDRDKTRAVLEGVEEQLAELGVDVTMGALVPVFVRDGQGLGWSAEWDRISQGQGYDPASRHEVRWRQLRHLVRLFHAKGVFLEDEVPVSRLAFQEWG